MPFKQKQESAGNTLLYNQAAWISPIIINYLMFQIYEKKMDS